MKIKKHNYQDMILVDLPRWTLPGRGTRDMTTTFIHMIQSEVIYVYITGLDPKTLKIIIKSLIWHLFPHSIWHSNWHGFCYFLCHSINLASTL